MSLLFHVIFLNAENNKNRAETEVNILFIKKEVMNDLLPIYADDIKKIRALAYFRYKHFLFVNFLF